MELSAKDLAALDPAYWAIRASVKLQVGEFTFAGREYLQEPMASNFGRLVFMKGTQGGASLVVILKTLWGMIHGRYPRGVLYLMPTDTDIREFSQSKFGPLLADNYHHIGRHVGNAKSAASTTLKKVGPTAFLYLRSATLSRKVDFGYSESAKLKAISVDCVVFDELDTMEDQSVVEKAIGRMGASQVGDEFYIGNPGTPRKGIDEVFLGSDQRHWWIRCHKCTTETCAEKEFFDNPSFIKVRDDGMGFLSCKNCGNEIFVKDGYWKPDVPSKSESLHGYRWSQLIIPDSNPYQILQHYRYPPRGNLGDIMRTELGMPYIATDDVLTETQAYACCDSNRPMLDSHPGPCAMGVDVGDWKHIVIGVKTSRQTGSTDETFEIIKVTRLKDWDKIHDLARRFNVRSAVIDSGPLRDSARKFQQKAKYSVYLCQYNENTVTPIQYNPTTRVVKVNRTEIFDQTGQMIADHRVTFPRKAPAIHEFVKQLTDPVCIEDRDKRSGQLIRRYRGREDHFRNALNYFKLAANKVAVGSPGVTRMVRRATYATNNRSIRRRTHAIYG